MSVDPAAVSAASAAANAAAANVAAVEALIQSEIQALAADAQALQSQVSTGQVVTAQVLPSNGMGDLISILGNRVAAQLPPTLAPGDTFTAQVTGFNGDQILLQVLTAAESQAAAAAAPPAATAAAPQPPASALQAAATRPPLPEGVSPSVAPPPAVFVAASVRPAPAEAPPAAPQLPPTQAAQQQNVLLADIEARLLAARAAQISVFAPAAARVQAPVPPPPGIAVPLPPQTLASAATPPEAPPASASQTPVPVQFPGRFTIPPAILTSPRFADPVATTAANDAPPATGLAAFKDAVPLVRALGLPVTPTNVAAANLALKSPQRLPAALLTLESALPDGNDSRVATLRTLTAFIGKLDPQSPQLAAQISAYVDNVVTGNEPKLAQLLGAQLTADQAALPVPAAAAETAAQNAPAPAQGATVPLPAAPQSPTLPVMALAQLAERGAALSVDLKAQILALVNASPANAAPEFAPAASAALSAITSVQLNAAQAMNATPQTMQFTLPMFVGQGYAQARIAIDRDAPEGTGNRSLDGDNFHIAFVLDTKHLGTVTVDLQTVGRAFSLAVKTESEQSAKRFGESLPKLTGRLETLRYRVNSAEASVAARGNAAAAVPEAPEPIDDGLPSDVNVRA